LICGKIIELIEKQNYFTTKFNRNRKERKMKKFIVCLILILVLAIPGSVFAEIVKAGLPSMASSAVVDVKEDAKHPFIFTTNVRCGDNSNIGTETIAYSERISYTGLLDGKIRPYIQIGTEQTDYEYHKLGATANSETDYDILYGAGIDTVIKKFDTFSILGSLGYTYIQFDWAKNSPIAPFKKESVETIHTALIIKSDVLDKFKPYAGVGYVHIKDRIADSSIENNEDCIVPIIGANYNINDTINLGIESSYYDSDLTMTGSIAIQF
jgi:outer membrane protein W